MFQELDHQSDYVDVTTDAAVHGDAVRQVAYFPENETVVTCSRDPSATLVIRHVAARRTPYIFKLARVGNRTRMFRIQIPATNGNSQLTFSLLSHMPAHTQTHTHTPIQMLGLLANPDIHS